MLQCFLPFQIFRWKNAQYMKTHRNFATAFFLIEIQIFRLKNAQYMRTHRNFAITLHLHEPISTLERRFIFTIHIPVHSKGILHDV